MKSPSEGAERETPIGALDGLSAAGVKALRRYISTVNADDAPVIAVLGPDANQPLYPSPSAVSLSLLELGRSLGMAEVEVRMCLKWIDQGTPENALELLRQQLGTARYADQLRNSFSPRRLDPSQSPWTALQAFACALPLSGIITLTPDPGILDARLNMRPRARSTGFATWADTEIIERWQTGQEFIEDELPILFAHGVFTRASQVALTPRELNTVYGASLAEIFSSHLLRAHLVWIGFPNPETTIPLFLSRYNLWPNGYPSGTTPPRHIVFREGQPDTPEENHALRGFIEKSLAADTVFYDPNCDEDLSRLLALVAEGRVPVRTSVRGEIQSSPVDGSTRSSRGPSTKTDWIPGFRAPDAYTGRTDDRRRLERWAQDPRVRVIGISAWGGSGKTALVNEWVTEHIERSKSQTPTPVFGWSFYDRPDPSEWASALQSWSRQSNFEAVASPQDPAEFILNLLSGQRILLILDGLEVLQEGPGVGYGKLLSPLLRDVLGGLCRSETANSLVVLTSRFPFSDLEGHDGTAARLFELAPLSRSEGALLLQQSTQGSLPLLELEKMADAVDGHALALVVMGELLANSDASASAAKLREELIHQTSTNARVAKVLAYYSDRLSGVQRSLLAAISLWSRPVSPAHIVLVAQHPSLQETLGHVSESEILKHANALSGLVSVHEDGSLSVHPVIRETFREIALGAAELAGETNLEGVPRHVSDVRQVRRVVETIELLLAANEFTAADSLYLTRTGNGTVFKTLPAPELGQRVAELFVGERDREDNIVSVLGTMKAAYYHNGAGLFSLQTGDVAAAHNHIERAIRLYASMETDDAQIGVAVSQGNACLAHIALGAFEEGAASAADGVRVFERVDAKKHELNAVSHLAYAVHLVGETNMAIALFLSASALEYDLRDSPFLSSTRGVWLSRLLIRAERLDAASELIDHNLALARKQGWVGDLATTLTLGSAAALQLGSTELAYTRAGEAVRILRRANQVIDLVDSLLALSRAQLALGDLGAARRAASEALDIASSRQLTPARVQSLIARAASTPEASVGERDLRIAVADAERSASPWDELDARVALAKGGMIGGEERRQWSQRVDQLRVQLAPSQPLLDQLCTFDGRSTFGKGVNRLGVESAIQGNLEGVG